MHEASDVHALPADDDDALEFPPAPAPADGSDAFAEFEDEIEGETTRIDDGHLLAEQSTAILEELPAQPFLFVEKGADQGREFVLQHGENGIGRGIDNDVILADVAVSRRHLLIFREGDVLRLKDLGSGNGTQINGRKLSQVLLNDGDRLELGETVLVVRVPNAALPAVDPYGGEGVTDENHVVGVPGPIPTPSDPFAMPMSPGYQPELTPSATASPPLPPAKGRGIVLPRPIAIAALVGGAMLLAMFGAAIAVLVVTASGDEEEPPERVTLATEEGAYARGVTAFEAHRWDDAESAFREALQEGANPQAQQFLERLPQARQDERVLVEARAAGEAGDWNSVLNRTASVGADSPLSADATELRARARVQLVQSQIVEGRRALAAGELDAARAALTAARNIDPEATAVGQLEGELRAAQGATAPEPAPEPEPEPEAEPEAREQPAVAVRRGGSTPRRAGGGGASAASVRSAIIDQYLAGNFSRAASMARAGAGRARNAAERRDLESLERRITQFGSLWTRIQAGRFGPSVRSEMSQAMGLDRNIARNGRYRNQLSERLVTVYLAQARADRDPIGSCRAVRQALGVDARHAQARQMAANCERQARGMMSEAARQSGSQQMTTYRRVLQMVPSSSPIYQDANRRLQATARRTQSYDEDE